MLRSTSRAIPFVLVLALVPLPAIASSFTEARANIPQVSGDGASDATALFPTNRQSEPTIAVNPVNGVLLAGSNDYQRTPACAYGYCGSYWNIGRQGVYRSTDGGFTWANLGVLDDSPGWEASGLYSMSDPVIAWGPRPDENGSFSWSNGARAYYSFIAAYQYGLSPYPSTIFKGVIAVSWSDDDGSTWSAPVIVESRDNAANFNDKEWLTVDDHPSSPYFGRVYVSWTDFRSDDQTHAEPIMLSVSKDGGASFGTAIQLSNASNPAGPGNGRQDSAVRTGPDGSAYVAWADASTALLSISRDGGKRWSKPQKIGTLNQIDDPIPGASFRTGDPDLQLRLGLTLATDPRPGSSRVYAAWVNKTGSGGRVAVVTSTNKGKSWGAPVTVSTATEGYAFFPAMDVADDGRVDVGYLALLTADPFTWGIGNATIDSWYVHKPASGAWSAPMKVSGVSSDPAVSAQSGLDRQHWGDYTTIESGSSTAWFIYTDGRSGAGCAAVDAYQHDLSLPMPWPPSDCPAQFGNTDIWVSVIQP